MGCPFPNAALVGQAKDLRGLDTDYVVESLEKCMIQVGSEVSTEQKNAWKGSWKHLKKVFSKIREDTWVIFEYSLPMNNQRIDVLFLGRNSKGNPSALVLELKGWRAVKGLRGNSGLVVTDQNVQQRPDIQAADYAGKLKFSHSRAQFFDIKSVVWLYNIPREKVGVKFPKSVTFFANEAETLAKYIRNFIVGSMSEGEVREFLEGEYTQTIHLLKAIKENFKTLKEKSIEALASKGFAPSQEQQIVIDKILYSLRKGDKKTFLIQGGPGSGKTYIAILLLLSALSEGKSLDNSKHKSVAVLAYRNNRLINTLRKMFDDIHPGLNSAIKFTSARHNKGVADKNPYTFKIAIFDEAQRLNPKKIPIAMSKGDITVFLYDETQILTPEEGGTTEAFEKAAKILGIEVERFSLKGFYRVQGGQLYHEFVEDLIKNPLSIQDPTFSNYEFRVFTDIEEMLESLRKKAKNNFKVALVASFTEAPGDRKNKQGKTLCNKRVGYPLYSGFEHYKDKNVEIYWLMDEKAQYPSFWYECQSNELTHCASIYGCQGFEADYVGVIWGRDLVWDPRKKDWALGSNCEDDVGKPSLKDLFYKRKEEAIYLLKNRYRIFLTRGILGTYIYCEDENTKQLLKSICDRKTPPPF